MLSDTAPMPLPSTDGLPYSPQAGRGAGPGVDEVVRGAMNEAGDRLQMMAGPHKDGEGEGGTGVGVATRTRTRTKKPSLYKVLMLNDDYTPMEFVVLCLQRFFRMGIEDATRVMLHVHQKGVGVCGVFSHEVAETKATQVVDFARQHQHPLQCTIEKA